MGQIVADVDVKVGAVNVEMLAGPTYSSPFILHSILYRREKTEAIDIIVEVVGGGQSFLIDRVLGTGDVAYVFPNQRAPHPIALPNGSKIYFRTDKITIGDEKQRVMVNWSDFT